MSPLPVPDLSAWLAGRWRIERVINDGAGTFAGTAEFRDDGAGGLRWHEQGRVRYGALDGPAHRTLRLAPGDGGAWDVLFDDGRPFHALDLRTGRCAAEHLCGADTYRGAFVARDDRRMTIRWRVDGPRKADVIASEYERA